MKHYGLMFTCMTSRSLHYEVAHPLDTDSCVQTIGCFICRRGQVKHVKSENGRHFVGAEGELREALAALNQDHDQDGFEHLTMEEYGSA